MCRLFGLSAGPHRVHATFWLLDAPDSLQLQGRRNPDGTGLGHFTAAGEPVVDKEPVAAYSDVEFIREAKTVESTTFVAHVRVATTGELRTENTHPFAMDGRVMAHNGGFEGLGALEAELGDAMAMVEGDTDSERYMALVTREIGRHDGDVGAGIGAAAGWLAAHVPLFSLNLVLATPTDLWALRYPDHHRLYVLDRAAGGPADGAGLRARGELMEVTSDHPHRSVVVASEPMDGHDDWRLMDSGELVHVHEDLTVTSSLALPDPPAVRAEDPLPYVP